MPNSPLAVGAQTRLSLMREAVFNTPPVAPTFQTVRPTDLTVAITPKFDQSKEIRQDGMDADQILVGDDVSAKFGFEFSVTTADDIIEAALRTTKVASPEINKTAAEIVSVAVGTGVFTVAAGLGTPFLVGHLVSTSGFANAANNATSRATATAANTVTLGGVAGSVAEAAPPVGARIKVVGMQAAAVGGISATAAPNTISIAATNPATLGIVPGMWLRLSGFTGNTKNNDLVRVGGPITGAGPWIVPLDIVPTGWAADAAAAQIVSIYFTDYFRPGNTRNSYAAEEAHLDLADYKYAFGLVIDSLQETIKPKTTIPMAASFVGLSGGWQAQIAAATYKARTTTKPLNTSSNVGKAYINGAWINGVITSADYTFKANAKVQDAVGSFGGADITYGPFQITGSLEKYFLDATLNALMMAGTPTTLVFVKRDNTTGTTYVVEISAAQLMDGQPPVSNSSDPIKEPYKWTANVGPNGYMCHIGKFEGLPAVGV